MTLARLLESHKYPLLKGLVIELQKKATELGENSVEGSNATALLDEVRHLVVLAFNPKELPR